MQDHPNASAAVTSGGVAALAVYLLNKYAHTHLNQVDGAAIAGTLIGARLYVGRRGIKRALLGIWNGTDPPTPTPLPPSAPPAVPPPGL